MSSIDALLTRAKRLHGVSDDALEVEWNNMIEIEVESLLADLDASIANRTPEEVEAEQHNNDAVLTLTPELEAELTAALAEGEGEIKKYWLAQQRKKRRRGRQ